MTRYSYLNPANAAYIEELYQQYIASGNSVDDSWAYFFDGLSLGSQSAESQEPPRLDGAELEAELNVYRMIVAYRTRGGYSARLDPLADPGGQPDPELALSRFGLSQADLGKTFRIAKTLGLPESSNLSAIVAHLKDVYCSTVAVEIELVEDAEEKRWLRAEIETAKRLRSSLSVEMKKRTLERLVQSEAFERFLHTRYVAKKRFSIEGGEAMIPGLDTIIDVGCKLGAEQAVFGMAHRGRLNVLTNVFGKKPEYIFSEFEDQYEVDPSKGDGDVKYHMGYSADASTTSGRTMHLSLASNPSHLEFVNPVVEGVARAKQNIIKDVERTKIIPVLIHGDAAFAGQGVVYESIAMSLLPAYRTGGTIHIVINNQVGFTTDAADARSTAYCTDLAKSICAPIFHVNGDDPEAVVRACELAIEYRQKFRKDIFVDLVCYRKYGHNEGDEPSFTQPVMYKKIAAHLSPAEVYAHKLVADGVVTEDEYKGMIERRMSEFTEAQTRARAEKPAPFVQHLDGRWKGLKHGSLGDMLAPVDTAFPEKKLKEISKVINTFPEGFHLHPKLTRLFDARLKAVETGEGLDWGCAELLAYATLLTEGHDVRLTGQDVERGTFTHRHAIVRDTETNARLNTLNRLNQKTFLIFNSFLSETAVMGFEYGFSLADPATLVIWEAQFGDFANGAQVIIDQFLASGESKWQKSSGLVLLLPHGYEGQGPEHSSARLERFLQLCGEANLSVVNLTTPANLFHAMRRQIRWKFRKPLVVMSPKSLLRHPMAISTLEDLSEGAFQETILDSKFSGKAASEAKSVVFCSGKVYYDLVQERDASDSPVALVRVEQLYPWPAKRIADALKKFTGIKPSKDGRNPSIKWVQEEPKNMGAWSHVLQQEWPEGFEPTYVGRKISASPAVGSTRRHDQEQKRIIADALGQDAKSAPQAKKAK